MKTPSVTILAAFAASAAFAQACDIGRFDPRMAVENAVVDCHPNDHGMMSMAKAFEKAVREALGIKSP